MPSDFQNKLDFHARLAVLLEQEHSIEDGKAWGKELRKLEWEFRQFSRELNILRDLEALVVMDEIREEQISYIQDSLAALRAEVFVDEEDW